MTQVIEVNEFGQPEVLKLKKIDLKAPGRGEVLVRQTAVGINYNDILARQGLFDNNLPFTPGTEACGVVEEIGSEVRDFRVGDRVAYVTALDGAYAEARLIDYNNLILVPDYVKDQEVAACLAKGMTAHYLIRRTFFVLKGNIILVYDASGETGLLTCMMAKQFGATVIAAVDSDDKKHIAKEAEADLVLNYRDADFEQKVIEYTQGNGVNAVYDFVGKETIEKSQNLVGQFGLVICCGFISGIPNPLDFRKLYAKSSFLTCPNFMQYKSDKRELLLSASEIFAQLQKRLIKPHFYRKYHLDEIQMAHKNLQSGEQVGQSIIII